MKQKIFDQIVCYQLGALLRKFMINVLNETVAKREITVKQKLSNESQACDMLHVTKYVTVCHFKQWSSRAKLSPDYAEKIQSLMDQKEFEFS